MLLAVGRSRRLSSTTAHEAGVMRRLESGVREGSRAIRGSPGAARWRERDGRSAPRLGGARILLHPRASLPSQGTTRQSVTGDVT
jgi:hypothetical protein